VTTYRFLATCPKGLGSLLAPEVVSLGGDSARETVAGVQFSGSLAVAYRVCLHSRLANRLLLELREFGAETGDDLYTGMLSFPWDEHIGTQSTIAIDFSGRSQGIRNTQFGAQRCKDGVVDQLRRKRGNRPNVDTKNPDIRINVRLHRGKATVALDLSGHSLHRRGYRIQPGKAPLKENIAAALLMRAGWLEACEQGQPLIDPMCGSGTLLIEAAMMATCQAPGLGRSFYGFNAWLGHNEAQWHAIVADAKAQVRPAPSGVELRGYDGDIAAIRRAQASIEGLQMTDLIRVRPRSLSDLNKPSHRPMPQGLLVCNPPWGERLGEESAMQLLYRQLGEVLHREFQGWRAAVVTSNPRLGRAIGLRSHKQYALSNGALDIQLLLFNLEASNRLAEPDNKGDLSIWEAPSGAKQGQATGEKQTKAPLSRQDLSAGAAMFANRLRKNLRKLKPWLDRNEVSSYRLYDADMPEYAVAIDLYNGRPHIAEYAPPKQVDSVSANRRFEEVVAGVRTVLEIEDPEKIAIKRRQRQRGSAQYEKVSQRGERFEVSEGPARVLVNLYDYLDTGLFLDHRPLRLRIGAEARGRHFLNLFCYTGVASIHAALGGAHTSTSVDLSNTYLRWYRDNLALNGLSERQHRAERADVRAWLQACERTYDLILLDPPSFSNSKSTEASFDVQRDHVALIEQAVKVLSLSGTLYFSNNRRGFKLDSSIFDRYRVTDISAETIPEDFARRTDIHQCWRIQHR